MWKVVPEGTHGRAAIEHFDVSEEASRMTALQGGRGFVPPGRYARLKINGETVMSDTGYERRTSATVVARATGRVLVAGYGLGMVLIPILKKPDVREVVCVEIHASVIALVDPHIRAHVGRRAAAKLVVEHADIYEARPRLRGPFDCLWFDVWGDVSTDALLEMHALTRKYRALKSGPLAFMDCWDREWLRYRRAQERRNGW